MNLTPEEIALLQQGASATQAGQPTYGVPAQLANLVQQGLVETNPAMVDGNGNVAYRASAAGLAHAATLPPAAPVVPAAAAWGANAAPAAAPAAAPGTPAAPTFQLPEKGFAIGHGFIIPVKKSARTAGSHARNYDFAALELGGFTFVPATKERPDPKKSLASTISSANKRYKAEGKYFKTFRAKAGVELYGQVPPTDGAYIVRVEPPVEAEPAAAA